MSQEDKPNKIFPNGKSANYVSGRPLRQKCYIHISVSESFGSTRERQLQVSSGDQAN